MAVERQSGLKKVRLTRKLAERVNGINLADRSVGEVFEIPSTQANLLIAEGWATVADDQHRSAGGRPFPDPSDKADARFSRSGRRKPAR